MAKFIKTIVDRINLLNRKGLCPYYSPDQICDEVHAASLNLWKKYVAEFERTQLISVFLEVFRIDEDVTITGGGGFLTATAGMYKTGIFLPNGLPVTQLDISHWGSAIKDSVRVPDEMNPICRMYNDRIVVRPTTITAVAVVAIKRPLKPVYSYSVVSDDYVYNDDTSIDIEWPEEIHDEIVDRVMASLGISQREGALAQYSNMEKSTEGR